MGNKMTDTKHTDCVHYHNIRKRKEVEAKNIKDIKETTITYPTEVIDLFNSWLLSSDPDHDKEAIEKLKNLEPLDLEYINVRDEQLKIVVELIEDLAFGGFNSVDCRCKKEARKALEKIKELDNE